VSRGALGVRQFEEPAAAELDSSRCPRAERRPVSADLAALLGADVVAALARNRRRPDRAPRRSPGSPRPAAIARRSHRPARTVVS
jgi:hypothetical protein